MTAAPTFEIRNLETAGEMASIVTLFSQVWGTTTPIVNVELLCAIAHSGGYVAAVYEHERVLGLGATLLDDSRQRDPEEPLRVYGDPDGHPFCVFVG